MVFSAGKPKTSAQKHWGALLLLTVLAVTALLFTADDHDPITPHREEPHRRLESLLNVPDPYSNATSATTVLTIHITDAKNPTRSWSTFTTDLLRRYGTGRISHRVVEHRKGNKGCLKKPLALDDGPCLAVSKGWFKYHYDSLKCNFPRCTTMVTNDEFCKGDSGFDVRQYASSKWPNAGYLPLGPRGDSWKSFRKIQASPGFVQKPASARRYAFNAIFSVATSKSRKTLAEVIQSHAQNEAYASLTAFTSMSTSWPPNLTDPRTTSIDTDRYMEVVLDSVFTLAPAGHNPECYRMFEAVEAGSIPVFLREELHYTFKKSKCHGGLVRWYDAPVLVVDSWVDLFPAISDMMKDPAVLDARQEEMRRWYDEYMRSVVAEFEDLVLAKHLENHIQIDS